jgi:hypothetical protein
MKNRPKSCFAGILAFYNRRSFNDANVGHLADGDFGAVRCGDKNTFQLFRTVTQFTAIAQVYRVALQALHRLGDIHPSDGAHNDILDISNRQPIPGRFGAIDLEIEEIPSGDPFGVNAGRTRNISDDSFHFAQIAQDLKIVSHQFDAQICRCD